MSKRRRHVWGGGGGWRGPWAQHFITKRLLECVECDGPTVWERLRVCCSSLKTLVVGGEAGGRRGELTLVKKKERKKKWFVIFVVGRRFGFLFVSCLSSSWQPRSPETSRRLSGGRSCRQQTENLSLIKKHNLRRCFSQHGESKV